MTATRNWSRTALNTALVVFGLGLLVLLYAFVTGSVLPDRSPPPVVEEIEEWQPPDRIIQVEVRNGSGVSGIARRTTSYLRGAGYDVVEAGNHSSFDVERSEVVDRAGDISAAVHVATALGISEDQVRQDVRPEAFLDASVVIGHDYESLAPFQNP